MPSDPELDALEATLDPATRVVVRLLRSAIEDLKKTLNERDEQIAKLVEQLAEFQRMLFGQRREKLPPIADEVRRVVEAEELERDGTAKPTPEEQEKIRRSKARKKSEPARAEKKKLRKNLPVVHETVAVTPEDLPEGYCLEDFREVGEGESVQRIEHVQEHLVIVEYRLPTLVSMAGDLFVRARMPLGVVDGGHYGASVYAKVVTEKCLDSLPLYRIEKRMRRAGCGVARSTLCGFFHRSATLLKPIYDRILSRAQHDPYLHADETRLNVQQKDKCLTGWIWGLFGQDAIAYTFDESRKGEVAKRLLLNTSGFLIIDGYAGYTGVTDEDAENGRIRVGCWAHCRRKFWRALASYPRAREALDMIVDLYRIEHRAAEKGILGTEAHLALRKTESAPIVDRFESWVENERDQHRPKGLMGTALTYAYKQRQSLRRFLDDPKLSLDNNLAERGLRIFAVGRKNFMFAGHVEGAQNLAVLQSIVSTCLLHDINPYEYLKDVLIRTRSHPQSRIEELMPWNWRPPPEQKAEAPASAVNHS